MLWAHEAITRTMTSWLEVQGTDNTRYFVKKDTLKIIHDIQLKQNSESTKVSKPYSFGLYGSAWGCMKSDDTESFIPSPTYITFAGRSFLGLGTILTGAKTYEELMSLAEKGNNSNLDMTTMDISKEVSDVSLYQKIYFSILYHYVMYKKATPSKMFIFLLRKPSENYIKTGLFHSSSRGPSLQLHVHFIIS